jgi:hypothetical protein
MAGHGGGPTLRRGFCYRALTTGRCSATREVTLYDGIVIEGFPCPDFRASFRNVQSLGEGMDVSIQVTAAPVLWPGHVCSPGDSGQAEGVGACPVGQVGAGIGGVHGL